MATESFNSNQLRQIVEIGRGKLEEWTVKGYLVPSYFEDAACGKRCMWSRDDIYKVAIMRFLVESDLLPVVAHEFFEELPNIKSGVDDKIDRLFG